MKVSGGKVEQSPHFTSRTRWMVMEVRYQSQEQLLSLFQSPGVCLHTRHNEVIPPRAMETG